MTKVLHEVEAFRSACDAARSRGERVALVLTMGALHDGHLHLAREAKRHGGFVAVTIFVNPTQFGPSEDFSRYPRDLEGDRAKLATASVDVVFAPTPGQMYPPGDATRVRVTGLTDSLCGPFRPGHFEGVATVVSKFFAAAGPSAALFGRKDYQQLQVIRRLVRDLLLPIEVIGVPTVREPDGLALSSRNAYLSAAERQRALGLSRGLRAASEAFERGERGAGVLRRLVQTEVAAVATSIDYVTVADPDSLAPLDDGATAGDRVLCAIAARVGTTRLIDNAVLGEDPPLTGG
jgi:pantoate--beta-alanine ligase